MSSAVVRRRTGRHRRCGWYALRLRRAAVHAVLSLAVAACGGGVAPAGDGAELEPGKALTAELGGGERRVYRAALGAGDYARIVVDQRGVDVAVRWQGPGGATGPTVDTALPSGDRGPEVVHLLAQEGGVYALSVEPLSADAEPGGVAVELVERRPATERDRLRTRAAHAYFTAKELDDEPATRPQALARYRDAANLWQEVGEGWWRAAALRRIGSLQQDLDDGDAALRSFRESRRLYAELGEIFWQAILEDRLGELLDDRGDDEAAAEHLRRAAHLYRAADDLHGVAVALKNLAEVYRDLGESQAALDAYGQARRAYRQLGSSRGEAAVLLGRGYALLDVDRAALAEEAFRHALGIFESRSDARGVAQAHQAVADAAYQAGRLGEALEHAEASLALRREEGRPVAVAAALNTLGNVLRRRGEVDRAEAAFREGLEILRRQGGEPVHRGTALVDLARLLADGGRHEEALELYRAAESVFPAGDRRGIAAARMGAARVLHETGRHRRAAEAIRGAVELVGDLRRESTGLSSRASYRAFRQTYHELEVDVLMGLAQDEPAAAARAFEAAERGRARALLDGLAAPLAPGAAGSLLSLEREALQRRISALADRGSAAGGGQGSRVAEDGAGEGPPMELERLLLRLDEVDGRLRRELRGTAAPVPEVLGLAAIRSRVLDQDTLLLAYALGPRRSYLWLVSSHHLEAHELPGEEVLAPRVRRAHELLQRVGPSSAELREEVLAGLSSTLLGPVARRLGDARLLVVADGALHYLPFATLPDPRSGGSPRTEPGAAPPLLARHEVVHLPSASVLATLRRRHQDRGSPPRLAAALADPVFESTDPRLVDHGGDGIAPSRSLPDDLERSLRDAAAGELARLPHSRHEAQALAALVPEEERLLATGPAASRGLVQGGVLSRYRVVHFATHALVHPGRAELSGLVLSRFDSRGRPRDGFVRAYEIAALDLPCELVVLSACETALGEEVRGEGLMGLTRAFMSAGTARVVASLWRVDDRATAELMQRFYRRLLVHGEAPAAALRQAQIEMWQDDRWSSPRYWGAFLYQGEWRAFPIDGGDR